MFGTTVYSTTSEDNGEDAGADNDYDSSSLSSNILFEWERRKVKMDHDYVVTGWALSVIHDALPISSFTVPPNVRTACERSAC